MSGVPPIPPLKSSQRLSLPSNLTKTPSVRVVEDNEGPLIFSRPSARRTGRSQKMDEDPRRVAQNAVRQAAGGSAERPILDRGRPRIDLPETPQRQDSARSPPGTRTPLDIDLDDGFSYIDDDTEVIETPHAHVRSATQQHIGPRHTGGVTYSKSHSDRPVSNHRRTGSFGNGKPRGLSFHDARQFMRSGRSLRPGSWHEAPTPTAQPRAAEFVSAPPMRTTSRSRSHSPPRVYRPRSRSPVEKYGRDEEEGFHGVTFDDSSPSPDQRADFRNSGMPPKRKPSRSPPLGGPSERPIRRHLVAAAGEMIGTTSFLFTAFGGAIVASTGSPIPAGIIDSTTLVDFSISRLLYMSFAFGISYMINVWIFFRASEGLFNPAVTLAFLITGTNGLVRSVFLFVAQIIGAIAASALALALFQTTDPIRTVPPDGVSIPRALFIEAVLTSQLVLTILMLAREKHKTTSVAPLGIGLALVFGELVGIFWTGGSLNPVRSFGPSIVSWQWDSTHWIYWIGPFIGSLIAVVVHRILMMLGHELGVQNQRNDVHVAARQFNNAGEKQEDIVPYAPDNVNASRALTSLRYADSDLTGVINLWHRNSTMGERAYVVEPSGRRTRL